jgi:multimeric flavodoxin WrbA
MDKKAVLILEASPRKGFSAKTAEKIAESLSDIADTEILALRDLNIKPCTGCCLCLSKGSAFCPHHADDVRLVLEKMRNASGVVYVVPNYSLQVSATMKQLLDRLAYVFHRPRLFGITFMPVVVQGVYGGGKIAKYLNDAMEFWGMKPIKGAVVAGGIFTKNPQPDAAIQKNEKALKKSIDLFKQDLLRNQLRNPSFFRLMIFRSTRSSMKYFTEALEPDKQYFKQNGWFTSDYYYQTKLNPIKRFVGGFVDIMIKRMAGKEVESTNS